MRLLQLVLLSVLFLAACEPATGSIPTPTEEPKPVTTVTSTPAYGVLEGRVTIGPLTPVERAGVPTPTVPPEVYAARSIDIFQADGTTRVVNVKISSDGTYHVKLPPGTYVVNIAKTGIDRGTDLPKTVTLASGQTTRLDIDIDTGIR